MKISELSRRWAANTPLFSVGTLGASLPPVNLSRLATEHPFVGFASDLEAAKEAFDKVSLLSYELPGHLARALRQADGWLAPDSPLASLRAIVLEPSFELRKPLPRDIVDPRKVAVGQPLPNLSRPARNKHKARLAKKARQRNRR